MIDKLLFIARHYKGFKAKLSMMKAHYFNKKHSHSKKNIQIHTKFKKT